MENDGSDAGAGAGPPSSAVFGGPPACRRAPCLGGATLGLRLGPARSAARRTRAVALVVADGRLRRWAEPEEPRRPPSAVAPGTAPAVAGTSTAGTDGAGGAGSGGPAGRLETPPRLAPAFTAPWSGPPDPSLGSLSFGSFSSIRTISRQAPGRADPTGVLRAAREHIVFNALDGAGHYGGCGAQVRYLTQFCAWSRGLPHGPHGVLAARMRGNADQRAGVPHGSAAHGAQQRPHGTFTFAGTVPLLALCPLLAL